MLLLVPASLVNVSGDQTVHEESNMQLFCEATGKPPPNITWTKVLEDGRNSEILHRGPILDFPNINRTATGTYHCTANNGIGNEVSHAFQVNVTCKYFTVCETLFMNSKRAPWFNNQAITIHICHWLIVKPGCPCPIGLLYNFG